VLIWGRVPGTVFQEIIAAEAQAPDAAGDREIVYYTRKFQKPQNEMTTMIIRVW